MDEIEDQEDFKMGPIGHTLAKAKNGDLLIDGNFIHNFLRHHGQEIRQYLDSRGAGIPEKEPLFIEYAIQNSGLPQSKIDRLMSLLQNSES